MEVPLTTSRELIRPWRRATLIASGIAAVELVLLIGVAAALLAKPLSHALRHGAQTAAKAAPAKHAAVVKPALHRTVAPPRVAPAIPRAHLRIMVLNGNGRSGAAAGEAGKLETLGYKVAGTANAHRQDYATSVVMYRPGFRAEGFRLAHDLNVKVVGPLDGLTPGTLQGGQLAVVLGA